MSFGVSPVNYLDSLLLLYYRAPLLISLRHKSIDFTVLGLLFINFYTFKAVECLYLHVLFNLFTQAVMLLIHKDIPHMPITELENGSESVWVKVFANKTSHFMASWYRPPDGKIEELELFKTNLKRLKRYIKETNPPRSMSWVTDFNFRDIVWPDRLNKQGF